jgi:enamine deaminase RidA (YjgF/YER057c/UK114 family)
MPKTLVARIVVGLAVVLVAVQFYRPARTNPVSDSSAAVDAGGHVPAQVIAILKRSCYDCHSNASRWPWYSEVAPMSWSVAGHVRDGRAEMNFSTWNTSPASRRIRRLEQACDLVRKGDMPLPSYLLLHRDAKMSESDVRAVCDWTADEGDRLTVQALGEAVASFEPVASHGGLITVSGILPTQAEVATDIKTQTAQVLDILSSRLAGAGSGLDRVVAASVYLAQAGDFAAMNEVFSRYFPRDPPTRTTVVATLPGASARIQISAVAVPAGAPRAVLLPTGWSKSPSPYSYAIQTADLVFLAGLVARDPKDNAPIKGDIEVQMRAIFDNANALLSAGGVSFADVVSARIYLTDAALFARMNTAYRSRFPKDPPARATVRTGLMSPDYLVEVTLLADRSKAHRALTTPAPDGTPGTPNPNLSSAIAAGPRLFLSGMLGLVPDQESNAAAQTTETCARLARTLKAAGYWWADVTESVVYVTDMATAPLVVETFKRAAGGSLRPGAIVGAGLMNAKGRVEIMVTAGK